MCMTCSLTNSASLSPLSPYILNSYIYTKYPYVPDTVFSACSLCISSPMRLKVPALGPDLLICQFHKMTITVCVFFIIILTRAKVVVSFEVFSLADNFDHKSKTKELCVPIYPSNLKFLIWDQIILGEILFLSKVTGKLV